MSCNVIVPVLNKWYHCICRPSLTWFSWVKVYFLIAKQKIYLLFNISINYALIMLQLDIETYVAIIDNNKTHSSLSAGCISIPIWLLNIVTTLQTTNAHEVNITAALVRCQIPWFSMFMHLVIFNWNMCFEESFKHELKLLLFKVPILFFSFSHCILFTLPNYTSPVPYTFIYIILLTNPMQLTICYIPISKYFYKDSLPFDKCP